MDLLAGDSYSELRKVILDLKNISEKYGLEFANDIFSESEYIVSETDIDNYKVGDFMYYNLVMDFGTFIDHYIVKKETIEKIKLLIYKALDILVFANDRELRNIFECCIIETYGLGDDYKKFLHQYITERDDNYRIGSNWFALNTWYLF